VKGWEKNDLNLRKGILDKNVTPFILKFYFISKAIKHVKLIYLFPQNTIKTLKKTGNNKPTTSHLSV
jgi:hypothetical protein